MTDDLKENVIEWYTGDDTVTVTVNQKKFVNRIKEDGENLRKTR